MTEHRPEEQYAREPHLDGSISFEIARSEWGFSMNEDILQQRYTQYRIQMKSAKTVELKRSIKSEMSDFLRDIAQTFGQDLVNQLTKKSK